MWRLIYIFVQGVHLDIYICPNEHPVQITRLFSQYTVSRRSRYPFLNACPVLRFSNSRHPLQCSSECLLLQLIQCVRKYPMHSSEIEHFQNRVLLQGLLHFQHRLVLQRLLHFQQSIVLVLYTSAAAFHLLCVWTWLKLSEKCRKANVNSESIFDH